MMIEADIALAAAKADPARRVHPFDRGLAERQRRRKTLADELHVAVENGDFVCHYQPQIDAQTGALAGVEALVRLENPRLGLLASDAFVPLAAELSLEHRIDRAAMEIALQDRARWQAYGLAVPKVSVNISALRLLQPDLDQELAGLDLASGALSFELLESISLEVDDDRIAWSLDMLRERGIGIEIDDFGTGRASVNGLLRVGPDRLKIDRSLILPADVDTTRRRIFELQVETGRTLGISVTAEGVENAEHARIARQAGCSVLQGFLYDGPLAPATLLARYGQMQMQSV
jgi:EAL domain-containing protein (putative c-di-GMP-specific phosphodiesterase class I)